MRINICKKEALRHICKIKYRCYASAQAAWIKQRLCAPLCRYALKGNILLLVCQLSWVQSRLTLLNDQNTTSRADCMNSYFSYFPVLSSTMIRFAWHLPTKVKLNANDSKSTWTEDHFLRAILIDSKTIVWTIDF